MTEKEVNDHIREVGLLILGYGQLHEINPIVNLLLFKITVGRIAEMIAEEKEKQEKETTEDTMRGMMGMKGNPNDN